MKTLNRWAHLLLVGMFACLIGGWNTPCAWAGGSFPAPHTPKPSGPYIEYQAPTAYPFTYKGWFNVSIGTTFTMPSGEFDTQANIDRNTPFQPFLKDKKVFMYFGPNSLGSTQLLNQSGCRLTPDKQVFTPFDIGSRLNFWHWRYEYDWTLVNYWYSVPCHYSTYCWSGGCAGSGKSQYCWSGGCSTYADDWNHYEVYYWTKGSFLRKVRQDEALNFEVRLNMGKTWNPLLKKWVEAYKSFMSPTTGEFARISPNGLLDPKFEYNGELRDFFHYWYQYYFRHPLEKIQRILEAFVHPLPPGNPTWRMEADGVWRDKIDDTKVKLHFKWDKPALNVNKERYYIEYGKLFDGKIKMRDIVKLLSNLGYDQVDVPVYMALESAEPKLYLVTTPQLVKGVKKAPAPYTPIPSQNYLSHAGVIPGYTLHPSSESFGRGYIRECIVPYSFEGGKPKAGPVKYIFSKMFDVNADGKIDSVDRAFLERGLKIADFDEDDDVDLDDCSGIWNHSFTNFPQAFEKLGRAVQSAITNDPRLLTNPQMTAYAGPFPITEVYFKNGAQGRKVAHIQIGWVGNALTGTFFATEVPGSGSPKYPLSPVNFRYTQKEFPGYTGAKFLPNLGPARHPSRVEDAAAFPELYRSHTGIVVDGTMIGFFKRLTVQVYRKCDYTGAHCYPVGDPWGIGLLESIESGVMGQFPLYGDVDGENGLTSKDLARWDEVKSMEGFILSSVFQHPIGMAPGKPVVTDLNREFRIIAGGKFSAYPPAGANSFTLKESYNYSFIEPTIWAYDSPEGNQMSFGRRFLPEGGWDPTKPPPEPPYPPTQVRKLPDAISGPDDVPEDIPQTWRAPGVEEVIIKPDTWSQTWSISGLESEGGPGTGDTKTYEFKRAGRYTITHTTYYTQRIVTPVTDSMGIIVYYAVTDIPQTRVLTLNVRVFDHDISEFEDPKLELKGPGNNATYAQQWGATAADLRKRDFPAAFVAFPGETHTYDTRTAGAPAMNDNDWKVRATRENGKEYIDHQFDLVNARSVAYDFDLLLEMKFARRVAETSDLNALNTVTRDHLEAYSGLLLEAPIRLDIEVKQMSPSAGSRSWKNFSYTPDVSGYGDVSIDPSRMGEYLVKVGDRYMKVNTAKFAKRFSWDLPVPTFPNEGYEAAITLNCTQRAYYLDHPSQTSDLKIRFGSAFSSLNLVGDGTIKYLDQKVSYIWRRKSFTVDVTPPTIESFLQHNGASSMVAITDSIIHGNTGDETEYCMTISDNHPGYGPNDGRKDGGTQRAWYPRLWFQKIDGLAGQFTSTATSGYEFPLVVPSVGNKSSMLAISPDGNLAPDVTNFTKERIDGHHLAIVAPTNIDLLGSRNDWGLTFRHRFSIYIAGKIGYVIEIEDGSRNFTRVEGFFKVTDNKRPNIDLRLATPKFKPVPDDGTLRTISQIPTETPLGPAVPPFGDMKWAPTSIFATVIAERTRASKRGLLANWSHPYDQPDQSFGPSGFSSLLQAAGYAYQRDLSLDETGQNRPLCEANTSKWDDPIIKFSDKDIKAAFQVANSDSPGFAEDEELTFDLSVRDNLLFWQDDREAPRGRIVADRNLRLLQFSIKEDVVDERKVPYVSETAGTPVKAAFDVAPLRLQNADGTALSHVFRVGNANVTTGWRNTGTGANTGSNTVRIDVLDLGNNSRQLFLDLPIIPSRFNIRVLESDTGASRQGQ